MSYYKKMDHLILNDSPTFLMDLLCIAKEADKEITELLEANKSFNFRHNLHTENIFVLEEELEAKDKVIAKMRTVLAETQELLLGGSKGSSSIIDTVWSSSTPNTTLYELIELTKSQT